MAILVLMLSVGLIAAIWGFMACFMPAQWYKLTEAMGFADRWTVRTHNRLNPFLSFGNRVAGLVIFAGGSWFTYLAARGIYRVLVGGAVIRPARASGTLASSPTTALTVLSVLMLLAGALMTAFPAKTLALCARAWPGRSAKSSVDPKVVLFVRLFGAALALLAIASLIR